MLCMGLFLFLVCSESTFGQEGRITIPDPDHLEAIDTEVMRNHEWGLIKTRTRAVITAPPAEVWKQVTNYERIVVGVPRLLTRDKPAHENEPILVHFDFEFPWPFRKKEMTLAFFEDPARHHLKWKKVKGSLRDHQGELSLEPWREFTLITIHLEQNTGFFVPEFLVQRAINRKIPDEIWRVRLDLRGETSP